MPFRHAERVGLFGSYVMRLGFKMLDVSGSLTVQESTFAAITIADGALFAKFLRADWPSDATWVHEMQFERAGATLPQSQLLMALIPSSCVQIGQACDLRS